MAMQHVTSPAVLSGAVQVPIIDASQIIVGAVITGPHYSCVRRVVEIDGNVAVLERWRQPQQPGHLHGFTLHSNTQCSCGLRREPLAGILPIEAGMARSFRIDIPSQAADVDVYTVYVGEGGKIITMTHGSPAWSVANMPIVPLLHPIWTLPAALRPFAT